MPSLYRKWRSRSFDELVGQDHVVRTLRNAVLQQRVAHAYLFTGPRGTGKTSTARILAKAVNCLRPQDGDPCNECETCLSANEGRALDVIEIDAASNTSVDSVRDLRERVAYAAGEGRYKVYIVDEVHRLSGQAFDAFLKTLEEPPPHVIFVFASTEPHKVPETIASRCQRFDFRRIPSSAMLQRLRFVASEEHITVTEEALLLLTLHAQGSLRDALGLLDQAASYTEGEIDDADVRQALGLADATLIATLTDNLLANDVGAGLGEFHRFVKNGGDPRQLTRQFVDYSRSLLLMVTGVPAEETSVDPALASDLVRHARELSEYQALLLLKVMTDHEPSSRFNIPAQLPFEMAYVEVSLTLRQREFRGGTEESADVPVAEPSSGPRPLPVQQPPIGVQSMDAPERSDASPLEGPGHQNSPHPASIISADQEIAPIESTNKVLLDVESVWPTIVANMRFRSPSLQAVLRSGHLMRTEGGEITIGFLYDFHRSQFADLKKRRLLEEVVAEVLGASYRVNCVRTTKEEVESLKGGVLDDDGFIEEVVERLREFHAKQVNNGHP